MFGHRSADLMPSRTAQGKTAQSAVLPCEVSEGIRSPDAVTEAAAFLTAAERAGGEMNSPCDVNYFNFAQIVLTLLLKRRKGNTVEKMRFWGKT